MATKIIEEQNEKAIFDLNKKLSMIFFKMKDISFGCWWKTSENACACLRKFSESTIPSFSLS